MKKIFLLSLFLFTLFNSLDAKNYRIINTDIKAYIKKNGVIHIEETRTYLFSGTYKWANFELNKKGFSRAYNFKVWEDESVGLYSEDESEDPGTFELKEKSNRYDLKWYYRADDEERTWTISYDLEGAIVSDAEWSEFYWTFLANGWDKANERIHIDVLFEEPTSLAFWADGYQPVNLTKMDSGWQLDASGMRKRDQIRVKTHFLTSYLTTPSSISGSISPDQADAIHEEYLRDIIEREELHAELAVYAKYIYAFIIGLSIFVFYHFYNKNKPEFDTTLKVDYLSTHPALLDFILSSRMVSPNALKSSIMKLIFDGFITLTVLGKEKKKWTPERTLIEVKKTEKTVSQLNHPFEKDLYTFILERSEIHPYFDDVFKKDQGKVSKWYMNWTKQVKSIALKQDWFVKEAKHDMFMNILLQLVLIFTGAFVVYALGPVGIVALIFPLMAAILSGAILHRNPEGEALYNTLKEKKKNITLLRKQKIAVPKEANWSLFLLALALGNSKEDVSYLSKNWASDSIPNILISTEFMNAGFIFMMDDMINVTHGAYFGASGGAGAGASAGAAGGGGGGGAG